MAVILLFSCFFIPLPDDHTLITAIAPLHHRLCSGAIAVSGSALFMASP